MFPGSEDAIEDEEEAVRVANKIGFPVIIKASAGGGGRGMKVCHNEATLRSMLRVAAQEAQAAFGNGAVFIEKYLEHARHVEIQMLGDKHGNAVYLWERDCSLQRRHQKVIEEAPAPNIDRKKLEKVCEAAAKMIRNAKYSGAATCEFLMDGRGDFYMLEVNTRVQVEHPVTEMITGVDIVKMSILIAAGQPIPFKQKEVQIRGHAIECRICAEDPAHGFRPSAGRIDRWETPGGLGVRLDSHVIPGYVVPPNYDSMIGKLIVHADTREQALDRCARACASSTSAPSRPPSPSTSSWCRTPTSGAAGLTSTTWNAGSRASPGPETQARTLIPASPFAAAHRCGVRPRFTPSSPGTTTRRTRRRTAPRAP